MTTAKKNVKIFILQGGNITKGNMAKGITVFISNLFEFHKSLYFMLTS